MVNPYISFVLLHLILSKQMLTIGNSKQTFYSPERIHRNYVNLTYSLIFLQTIQLQIICATVNKRPRKELVSIFVIIQEFRYLWPVCPCHGFYIIWYFLVNPCVVKTNHCIEVIQFPFTCANGAKQPISENS